MATFVRKAHGARRRKLRESLGISPLDNVPQYGTRFLTLMQIMNRDGEKCYLCSSVLATDDVQIEHIIARKHGGSDHPLNLALACSECNRRKRDLIVAFTIADRRPFFLLP